MLDATGLIRLPSTNHKQHNRMTAFFPEEPDFTPSSRLTLPTYSLARPRVASRPRNSCLLGVAYIARLLRPETRHSSKSIATMAAFIRPSSGAMMGTIMRVPAVYSSKSAPLAMTIARQAQITQFHSSAKRQILTPLPRELSRLECSIGFKKC